jgi:hypothetical protein
VINNIPENSTSDDRQLKPLTSFAFVVGDNTATSGSRHNFNIPPLSENVQWWPRDLLPQTIETIHITKTRKGSSVGRKSSCTPQLKTAIRTSSQVVPQELQAKFQNVKIPKAKVHQPR